VADLDPDSVEKYGNEFDEEYDEEEAPKAVAIIMKEDAKKA
jgi:hypothetical protein